MESDSPATTTLLLVEDEETLQDLYSERFTAEGFAVLQARTGTEALELVDAHPEINLILLDLMLPNVSGYDVLNAIKHNPTTQHIPVVIVSALADIDDQARGLQMGAKDYITKGTMLPAEVIEKIKRYALSIPRSTAE